MAIVLRGSNTSTFSSSVSVGGTVTYDDVKEIDSVGIITARSGLHVTSGNLGIGTDSPDSLLTLNAASNPTFKIKTANTVRTALISDTGNSETVLASYESYPLVFSASTGGGTAEKLRIDSSGNLTAVNTSSGGATTLKVGANATSGVNNGTIIINNGGTGDGALQFDYENSAARAKIYVYRSTQDLIFDTAGSERLRILSDGRVKIGDDANYSTSSGAKLSVELMSTAGTILEVADQTAGYSTLESVKNAGGGGSDYGGYILRGRRDADDDTIEYLRVDASGRLLLGTQSLINTSTASNFQIASAFGPRICIARNDTDTDDGNLIGALDFYGNHTATAGGYELVGRMLCEASENHTDGSKASDLVFHTCTSGTDTANEKVRITSAGYLGVATINPVHPLEVHSSTGTNIVAKSTDGNGGYLNYSGLASNGTTTFSVNHNGTIYTAGGLNFGTPSSPVTSKTLDDYEEGTWNPTINNLSLGNGTLAGHYTKIGHIVHLSFRLDGGSTTSFTGNMNGISGFPFAAAFASNTGYLTASNSSNNWFGFTTMYSASTGTNFIQWPIGSTPNYVGNNSIPFSWGSSTIMRFNITYRTT